MFKHFIVQVLHENGIPVYLGMPMGIVFEVEGKTIYHTGDTGLFSDMSLKREKVIQLVLMYVYMYQLEIILRWVLMMQVMLLMNLLNQKFLYRFINDTFPLIEQDSQQFKDAVNVKW